MQVSTIVTPRGKVYLGSTSTEKGRPTVVYVHGYTTTTAQAVKEHDLFGQFEKSGTRATFLVPEAPSSRDDSVKFPSLAELLAAVRPQIGTGPVIAVGHSGAYRTLKGWLTEGILTTVAVLDGLYGSLVEPLKAWAQAGGKVVLVGSTSTGEAMRNLASVVPAIDFRDPKLGHMALVTSERVIPDLMSSLVPEPTGANPANFLLIGGLLLAALLLWKFA